jgi:hypothetical protein
MWWQSWNVIENFVEKSFFFHCLPFDGKSTLFCVGSLAYHSINWFSRFTIFFPHIINQLYVNFMSILSCLHFLILSEFILQTRDQPLIRSYKFLSMSLYSYMKISYQNAIIFNIVQCSERVQITTIWSWLHQDHDACHILYLNIKLISSLKIVCVHFCMIIHQ